MDTYFKVIAIEIRVARKGYVYKTVTFEEIEIRALKDLSTANFFKKNFWPDRENIRVLNTITEQIQFVDWRGDPEFNSIKIGDLFEFKKIEFRTTPYQENGIYKDSYLLLIESIALESKYIEVAAKQLQYYNAFPIDTNGEIFRYNRQLIEIFDEE